MNPHEKTFSLKFPVRAAMKKTEQHSWAWWIPGGEEKADYWNVYEMLRTIN